MRNHHLLGLTVAMTITGCASQEREDRARKALASLTTDPRAMQLEDVRARDGRPQELCGSVNLKNDRGGYIGFKVFHVVNQKADIADPTISSSAESAVRACGTPEQIAKVVHQIRYREFEQAQRIKRWGQEIKLKELRLLLRLRQLEEE